MVVASASALRLKALSPKASVPKAAAHQGSVRKAMVAAQAMANRAMLLATEAVHRASARRAQPKATAWTGEIAPIAANAAQPEVKVALSASPARTPTWVACASANRAHALQHRVVNPIRCAPASIRWAAVARATTVLAKAVVAQAATAMRRAEALPTRYAPTTAGSGNHPWACAVVAVASCAAAIGTGFSALKIH